MNWEKGIKRLVWVLSIVIGFGGFLTAFFIETDTLVEDVLFWSLFGFGGTWLAYFFIRWAIRWIAKGFKADVPDRKDEPEQKE